MSFLHHTTVFISSHRHSVAVWHWAFRLYCCYGHSYFLLAYVRFHGRPVFLRQMLSACILVLHPALREPISYRYPYLGILKLPCSFSETKVMATPSLLARAVRPMRCT